MSQSIAAVVHAAVTFIRRGWRVVPIVPGTKKCTLPDWPSQRIAEAEVEGAFGDGSGLGILLGEPSGELVDVDLDDVTAVGLAHHFLPQTGLVHGRPGKPRSHYYYIAGGVKTVRFKDTAGRTIVELRGTGCQTVVPPSLHPSGEAHRWEEDGEPANVPADELFARVRALAVCGLLAQHWPAQGSRHDAALAAGGYLLRRGIPEEMVIRIVGLAARRAGDDQVADRKRAVVDSAASIERGDPTTGGPTLASLLGDDVVKRLNEWLGGADIPVIDVTVQHLPRQTREAWAALMAANEPPRLFVTNGRLVRLVNGDGGHVSMCVLQEDGLRHELARAAQFVARGNKGKRDEFPPRDVVRDMLANPAPPVPVLRGPVTAPTFMADGRLLVAPGYDRVAQLYYAPRPGFVPPSVPEAPTVEDLARAIERLRGGLLGDFPFTCDADRAHTLAFLIEPFVRPLIGGPTPLYVFDKSTPGSGASLLVECTAMVFLGTPPDMMAETRSDDEWRKRITAALTTAPTHLVIDNLRARLDSGALAMAITTGRMTDRRLGETAMVSQAVTCTWAVTGNNVQVSMELARRAVRIRLDAKVERPWERTGFQHPNLREWVRANRGDLVWAALTLVRAWLVAGQPRGTAMLGGFERWSHVLGGILAVAGIDGFLANQRELYEQADAESDGWRQLIARWWTAHERDEVTAQELWPQASGADGREPLDIGVSGATEQAQKVSFGRRLMAIRERLFSIAEVGTLRVTVVEGTRRGSRLWKLVLVDGDAGVRGLRGSSTPAPACDQTTAVARTVSGESHPTPSTPSTPSDSGEAVVTVPQPRPEDLVPLDGLHGGFDE